MDPISPWADSAECRSPDGRWLACFAGMEVRMGAPCLGTLVLSAVADGAEVCRLEGCNGSMVWSSESDVLALPRWRRGLDQDLALVALPSGAVRVVPGPWRVLQLESFEGRVVRGVDSPVSLPRAFEVALSRLEPLAHQRRLPG